jgi:hypothetical protein
MSAADSRPSTVTRMHPCFRVVRIRPMRVLQSKLLAGTGGSPVSGGYMDGMNGCRESHRCRCQSGEISHAPSRPAV